MVVFIEYVITYLPCIVAFQSIDYDRKILNIAGIHTKTVSNELFKMNPNVTILNIVHTGLKEIPKGIKYLTKLNVLKLTNNNLGDNPLQFNILSGLENLYSIDISNNKLKSISDDIGLLTNLTTLYLNCNGLENLPDSIQHLKKLKMLDLTANNFPEIPKVIGELENMNTFRFRCNRLSKVCNELIKLTKLENIELGNNELTSIPPQLYLLPSLLEVDLSNNMISSIDYPSLSELYKYCIDTQAEETISKLFELTRLAPLYSRMYKKLHWWSSKGYCFSSVTELKLDNNNIAHVSDIIAAFENIYQLDLNNNQIYEMPSSISALTNLTNLYLCNNNLRYLPASIKSLDKLNYVRLDGNDFARKSVDNNLGSDELLTIKRDDSWTNASVYEFELS